MDTPRTACPKDGDAFSYDPSHLRSWYVPRELWDHLPAELRESLAAVQHSGAAVLTGKYYYMLCNPSAFPNWAGTAPHSFALPRRASCLTVC